MKTSPQIFLSYVQEDRKKIEELYQMLSEVGFKPWMDKHDILAGENWPLSIQRAIRNSDFFLVCLSSNAVTKRGFFQKEIRRALDIWQEKLDSDIYLIPVRLENCGVPENLHDLQWVNLYEDDGFTQLVKAIQAGIKRRGNGLEPNVLKPMPLEPNQVRNTPSMDAKVAKPEEKAEQKKMVRKKSQRKKMARKKSQGKKMAYKKSRGKKKTNSNIQIDKGQIANPDIWIDEDQMWVKVHKEKRVVKHHYRLRALREVDQYRFKLRWRGSGKVEVNCESQPGDHVDEESTSKGWQNYRLEFSKHLEGGESQLVMLTYEILDENHGDFPYQKISYAHVAGCTKLVIHLSFSDSPFPNTIILKKYNYNGEILEKIRFATHEMSEGEYTVEIEPKPGVKYQIEWEFTQ